MAPAFDRLLRELFRAAGCMLVRQGCGSHEIWRNPITQRNLAVTFNISNRHTDNAILRTEGILIVEVRASKD